MQVETAVMFQIMPERGMTHTAAQSLDYTHHRRKTLVIASYSHSERKDEHLSSKFSINVYMGNGDNRDY